MNTCVAHSDSLFLLLVSFIILEYFLVFLAFAARVTQKQKMAEEKKRLADQAKKKMQRMIQTKHPHGPIKFIIELLPEL